jgi:hypothetical protein
MRGVMLQVSMSDVLERPEAVEKAYGKLLDLTHQTEVKNLPHFIGSIIRRTGHIRDQLARENVERLRRMLEAIL